MLWIYFRFRRHSRHGRTCCWLDPVANDPIQTYTASFKIEHLATLTAAIGTIILSATHALDVQCCRLFLSLERTSMKRPISPRPRWTPSKSRKLYLSFGFRDVAAIVAVLAFVAAFLIFYVTHPPPLRLTGSSLGPDWDCAPTPYATACVKRIETSK
jgi:hypothetical protein